MAINANVGRGTPAVEALGIVADFFIRASILQEYIFFYRIQEYFLIKVLRLLLNDI